ncbi:hypothetical protein [Mucisphaera calidilacus]|uniref:Undecaprenyl phosphate-alpha-4-amino-4-deoxy-L-arabinose arabinosyl transferase n=1 Tax=Mucisphaera calidilacus TaxID=2527982 RepID=A0A518BTB4_9BACT|nr:hypothetical protein [Mucisphaera calidilacus]QDU70216.1 Undecaprenyl phosphate-alpha-4-amino-4-deoxy-L-arabinose arabinosyl transferase [Mucisphaera calidilacus]
MQVDENPLTPRSPRGSAPKGLVQGLLLVLVVSLPGLVAGVVAPREATHHMERRVVITADETWRRAAGVRDVEAAEGWERYLLPYFGGEPRLAKPPLTVWATRLAWLGLDAERVDALVLMDRARWVAVGMTLVLLAGTYGIGVLLGGVGAGTVAGMSLGTSLVVQRWGRIASYDIYLAAFAALGLAFALAAARLLRTGSGQGWRTGGLVALGGVCVGLAWLSKGPIALAMVAVPMVVAAAVVGRRRWLRIAVVLLVLVVVGSAVALPWYGYLMGAVSDAGAALAREYAADRPSASPAWTYLGVVALMLPWTVWLVAGLVHPWLRRGAGPVRSRRGIWLAWWWLVVMVVVMSIPEAKQQRYILPVLPAAAVLIGLLVTGYDRSARRGRPERWTRVLTGLHRALVAVVTVLLVVGVSGWGLVYPMAGAMGVWALVGLAVVLGWRVVARDWRGSATGLAVATGLWAGALLPAYWLAYLPSDARAADPVRRTGLVLGSVVEAGPIVWLSLGGEGVKANPPDEKVMLFGRRRVRVIGEEDLGTDRLVVARDDGAYARVMVSRGYRRFDGQAYPNRGYAVVLWERLLR